MDEKDINSGVANESAGTDPQGPTDDSVGYRKPPRQRRFKPGKSGNQRGRPRGSKNRKTIVQEVANEMHTITEDGQQQRRSTLELVLLALRNRAAEGDVPAFRACMKYLMKFEPQESGSEGGLLVVGAGVSLAEAIPLAEKRNAEAIARRLAQGKKIS